MRLELHIGQKQYQCEQQQESDNLQKLYARGNICCSSTSFFASHACHTISSSGFDGVGDPNGRPSPEINKVDISFESLAFTCLGLSGAGEKRRRHSSDTDPNGYLAAIGVPISVPITSPEITNSTRRFC